MAFFLNLRVLNIAFEFEIFNDVFQFSILNILEILLLCLEDCSELLLVLVEVFATDFEPIHDVGRIEFVIDGSLPLDFIQLLSKLYLELFLLMKIL